MIRAVKAVPRGEEAAQLVDERGALLGLSNFDEDVTRPAKAELGAQGCGRHEDLVIVRAVVLLCRRVALEHPDDEIGHLRNFDRAPDRVAIAEGFPSDASAEDRAASALSEIFARQASVAGAHAEVADRGVALVDAVHAEVALRSVARADGEP